MTKRERTMLTGLGLISLVALLVLFSSWLISKNATNTTLIKNNDLLITQLTEQISRLSINPDMRKKDENLLAQLKLKKQAIDLNAASHKSFDIYGFSDTIKTKLSSKNIKVDQFQIDVSKKKLNLQAIGTKTNILSFLQSLENAEMDVQTWNFSLDTPAQSSGAGVPVRFSIGLSYAEAEK